MNVIELSQLFRSTWGYIAAPFPEMAVVKSIPSRLAQFEFDAVAARKETSDLSVSFYAKNSNNREIFMPIWLSENSRTALQYLLPNTIMSIGNKKEIVTTKLVNRDGTVKEEISLGDWEISVKGIIVSAGNDFPEAEMQLLVDWYKKRTSLSIQNARTAICMSGEEKVVITDLHFPENGKYQNCQAYEVRMVGDVEFSLYL